MTTVLLVDDEAGFVETLEKRLTKRGFDIQTALSAREAMKRLADSAIDVVLLDVKMPEVDGLTALTHIKEAYPSVEVILHSGHASLEASTEGLRSGAFDYLLKPAALEEIVYKIQDAARKKSLAERHGELAAPDAAGTDNET
jgi:DNA-binding NtrC family response regulator